METIQRQGFERDLRLILGTGCSFSRQSGLDKSALKRAYYRRAQSLHPDKARILGIAPDILSKEFRALAEAYSRVMECWESCATDTAPSAGPGYGPIDRRAAQAGPGFQGGSDGPRRRRLRFAQYLHREGIIDWRTMIDALCWQYRSRPKFGEIAMSLGYLSHSAVLEIIKSRKIAEPFGAAALRMGYLDQRELTVILGQQRLMGLPIGLFFTRFGFIAEGALAGYLREFHAYNLGAA